MNFPTIAFNPPMRPCMVGGTEDLEERAFFHGWATRAYIIEPSLLKGGHTGGQVCNCYGIVELENGQVCEVPPGNIRFLNPPHGEYAWPDTTDSK